MTTYSNTDNTLQRFKQYVNNLSQFGLKEVSMKVQMNFNPEHP